MENRVKENTTSFLVQKFESDLLKKYGLLLTGDSLREALGYRSMDAMRQAVLRGTIPIPLFKIKHRRGKFAYVTDVAVWHAEQYDNISMNKRSIIIKTE